MFEYTQTVDTITVETNSRETINKHLRKKIACKVKNRDTDLVVAVDICLRLYLKEEKDTELQMSLSKECKYLGP